MFRAYRLRPWVGLNPGQIASCLGFLLLRSLGIGRVDCKGDMGSAGNGCPDSITETLGQTNMQAFFFISSASSPFLSTSWSQP